MPFRSASSATRAGIWPLMLDPDHAALPPFTTAFAIEAARLAEFITPALAAYLLHPVSARYGRRLIAADPARTSRRANRTVRLRLLDCARVVREAGIEVAFIGEFASAHAIYGDADLRPIADLDVVVRHGDLERLVRHLGGNGFQPCDEPVAGAVSLVSDDGTATVALHLGLFGKPFQPAIDADDVLRAARPVQVDGVSFRVPCPEHMLLLVVSAIAASGFGKLCVREVVDAATLLRHGAAIDWPTVRELARVSRLGKPLRTLLRLLVALGLGTQDLPAKLIRRPRFIGRRKLERLAADYHELFQNSGAPLRA